MKDPVTLPEVVVGALAACVRQTPVATAVFDTALRYLAHSDSWLAAYGDPSGRSVVGMCHYDIFPEIRTEWRQIYQRCLAGATERRALDYFDRSDGQREYLRWQITPWRTADGTIGGLLIYSENISDQVITRQRLVEQQSLVRDFFAKSPIGLNLCRMDGLWIETNPAFLSIIGYSAEEVNGGLTYWQLTPRQYDAAEAVQLETLRRTQRYGPYEKEFIRKDGSLVPVRLNGFLVERRGEILIGSLIEDMTEQRALARKLDEERVRAIQSAKLATLGEMAAGFAHEINNPLSIIALYTEALKQSLASGDSADAEESIAAISAAVQRAGQIVHGLRKFSRQTAGEAASRVSVRQVIADAVSLCRHRMVAQDVQIITELAAGGYVQGHAIELSQVLINLLNNALDAVAGKAERWIRIAVDFTASEPLLAIRVEDSGGPLSVSAAERIFAPFYTTKRAGEGTGLGLSISRSIVEKHSGTLTLESPPDCTRFVVRLPWIG